MGINTAVGLYYSLLNDSHQTANVRKFIFGQLVVNWEEVKRAHCGKLLY